MRTRMRCLWHGEETPSLIRRKDDWYCYGACQKSYTHKEVEERLGKKVDYEYDEDDYEKEDLQETFQYIKSLPKKPIRGLQLPADERGYFITWDNDSYYKYRPFDPAKGSKYLGPKGHAPPLFWAKRSGSTTLYIVEGEINALSVSLVVSDNVCSPGSASCFNTKYLTHHLTYFKNYSNINIIVDRDAAGTKALIEAKALFLYKVPFVSSIQLEQDCNEVLIEQGTEGLSKALQRSNFK